MASPDDGPSDRYSLLEGDSLTLNDMHPTRRTSSPPPLHVGGDPHVGLLHEPEQDADHLRSSGREGLRRSDEVRGNYSVNNLDLFLVRVYEYFLHRGYWDLILERVSNLLLLAYTIAFLVFLTCFIDYQLMFTTYELYTSVSYPTDGIPGPVIAFSTIFFLFWIYQSIQCVRVALTSLEIKRFYSEVLRFDESDIRTVPWHDIVQRLIQIPGLERTKQYLTPLDITNRIMRKENYLIAMINKDVFDFTLPFPLVGRYKFLTKSMEWSLTWTVLNYVFDGQNGLRPQFLQRASRESLIAGMRRRFLLLGILGVILSPFVFLFLLVYFIFRYGEEWRNSPGMLTARDWSLLAQWKFREFNELYHVFRQRINRSYKPAVKYMDQFPSYTLAILARFVTFIVGGFLVVMLAFQLYDSESFTTLYITDGKLALWYFGVFGAVMVIARSFIPDEHQIFQPHKRMSDVVQHTHYMPSRWRTQCHTIQVQKEFSHLFVYRVWLFLLELVGVFVTPFVLIFSLQHSAPKIVDFVREFSVNLDGVGHVCVFATFDFENHGNVKYGATHTSIKRLQSKQGKMEKSYLSFKANYPEFQHRAGDEMLANLNEFLETTPELRSSVQNRSAAVSTLLRSSFVPGGSTNWRGSSFGTSVGVSRDSDSLAGGVMRTARGADSIVRRDLPVLSRLQQSYFESASANGGRPLRASGGRNSVDVAQDPTQLLVQRDSPRRQERPPSSRRVPPGALRATHGTYRGPDLVIGDEHDDSEPADHHE